MTLAIGRRDAGVTVAEISLKYIWDVVSGIKVGEHGAAYVVDADGKLIAHPELSLVLRNTDLSGLAQVQAAQVPQSADEAPHMAEEYVGRQVLTANAAITPLGWQVFVELPVDEAYAPLTPHFCGPPPGSWPRSSLRSIWAYLARQMIGPIRALQKARPRSAPESSIIESRSHR